MKKFIGKILTVGLAVETLLQSTSGLPANAEIIEKIAVAQDVTSNVTTSDIQVEPLVLASSDNASVLIAGHGSHSSHSSHSSHYSASGGGGYSGGGSGGYSGGSGGGYSGGSGDPYTPSSPGLTEQQLINSLPKLESLLTKPGISISVVDVKVNQKKFGKVGLLINGQSYIPTNLLKLLPTSTGLQKDLILTLFTAQSLGIPMLTYKGSIFIESSGVSKLYRDMSVSWDNKNKVVIVQTGLALQN